MNQTIKDGNAQGNPLGFAPIPGLIRKFAITSIIGMLVMAVYNITDQIFIGHVVGMYCTYSFTVNGYRTLLDVLSFIQNSDNIAKIPKDLPVFLIAGEEDPVGNYGKAVKHVYEIYKKAGIKDISIKLYKNDRHELINETDKEDVYDDIRHWLICHL